MDVLSLAVIASSLMLLVALLTYLSYMVVRKGSRTGNLSEPYLCGESVNDFKDSMSVGSTNLYWGSTSSNLKKFYSILRDEIHTGVLNDWFFYMGMWFVLAVILSFIVVSLGG
ncbi:MAG: hypothetical protein QXH57_05460 [Sulfolobales archaeon]